MTGPSKQAWLHQTLATDALGRFVEAMGVTRVLPVKGIVTARTLYADIAERTIADVDVRVTKHDFARVAEAAAEAGGSVRRVQRIYWNAVVDIGVIHIDIEATIGPPGLCRMPVDAMLARAREDTTLFGFRCLVPEIHDHALVMCVNVFKDKLVLAAPWSIEDCLRIAARPELDPELLARRAEEARISSLTWIVADWLAERGSPQWAAVRDAIGVRAPRRAYARLYRALVRSAPQSVPMRLLARAASDDLGMRLRAVARAAAYEARIGI